MSNGTNAISNQCSSVQNISEAELNASRSYDAVLKTYPEYRLSLDLYVYVLPWLVALGLFGNVLSFLVVSRKNLRHTAMSINIAVLAVFDSGVLIVSALRYWLGKMTGVDIKMINDVLCIIIGGFLYNYVRHCAVWVVVVITLERVLVVFFPIKLQGYSARRRCQYLLTGVCLVLFVFDFSTFFTYQIIEDCIFSTAQAKVTIQKRCYTQSAREAWPWIDLIMYAFLPISLIIIMNAMLMWKLVFLSRKKRTAVAPARLNIPPTTHDISSQSNSSGNPKAMNANKPKSGGQFNATPLVISTSFIVLTTPITIVEVIYADVRDEDAHTVAVIRLARTASFLLMYVNHSINLVLYASSGKMFRDELRTMLCGKCQR